MYHQIDIVTKRAPAYSAGLFLPRLHMILDSGGAFDKNTESNHAKKLNFTPPDCDRYRWTNPSLHSRLERDNALLAGPPGRAGKELSLPFD